MEDVIIRLLPDGLAQWAVLRGGEMLVEDMPLSLAEVAAQIPAGRVTVLVDGKDVLLTSVTAVPKQHRHLQTMLPFLVEDRLADDVHKLHFAAGPVLGGVVPVAAVEKSILEDWMQRLAEAGISASAMLPDMLAVPYKAQHWSLMCDENTAWLRTGMYSGVTIDRGMLMALLEAHLAMGQPAQIDCVSSEPPDFAPLQARYPGLAVHVTPLQHVPLGMMYDMHSAGALTLLQGVYKPKAERSGAALRWRKLAGVAALWFIAQMVFDGGQVLYISHRASVAREDAVALYQELFPADSKIVDPVAQMRQQLSPSGMANGTDFLPLLAQVAHSWNGADGDSAQIQSISYADTNRLLTVNIIAPRMETLNTLTGRLNADHLEAKLLSVINDKDGIRGQLTISGAGHE